MKWSTPPPSFCNESNAQVNEAASNASIGHWNYRARVVDESTPIQCKPAAAVDENSTTAVGLEEKVNPQQLYTHWT